MKVRIRVWVRVTLSLPLAAHLDTRRLETGHHLDARDERPHMLLRLAARLAWVGVRRRLRDRRDSVRDRVWVRVRMSARARASARCVARLVL